MVGELIGPATQMGFLAQWEGARRKAGVKSVCVCVSTHAQSCPTLRDPIDSTSPGPSVHGDSPGKNTRVSCHAVLQEIFPTQESNPRLLHCRRNLSHLSHQGSPGILEWVAISFSMRSSLPRD